MRVFFYLSRIIFLFAAHNKTLLFNFSAYIISYVNIMSIKKFNFLNYPYILKLACEKRSFLRVLTEN